MEVKLKKEEEDRQARRKRVEAIMSRTRAKGGTPSVTPSKVRVDVLNTQFYQISSAHSSKARLLN